MVVVGETRVRRKVDVRTTQARPAFRNNQGDTATERGILTAAGVYTAICDVRPGGGPGCMTGVPN
jgi:hypothetical protein